MKLHLIGLAFLVAQVLLGCQSPNTQSAAMEKSTPDTIAMALYPSLIEYLKQAEGQHPSISAERKAALQSLAQYIQSRHTAEHAARLTFICTHNSRRSHMGQIWSAVAAAYYGVARIETYSGGTEATAFNPRAVAALQRAGLKIENPGGLNPHYAVQFGAATPTLECFSKTYDDPYNPAEDFAAVMTCSEADKNCPLVPGAQFRLAIPYEDPKIGDGTDQEAALYDERSLQIASEMSYLMQQVAQAK